MTAELSRLLRAAAVLGEKTGFQVALIGGVARSAWALPRSTLDVDVIIGCPDLDAIVAHAEDAGLVAVEEEVRALAPAEMTRLRLPDHLKGPVRLDVIAATHPYYERVLGRARATTVLGTDIRIACAEDVILLKLLADRPRDRLDVEAIVEAQAGALEWKLIDEEARALEIELPEWLEPG